MDKKDKSLSIAASSGRFFCIIVYSKIKKKNYFTIKGKVSAKS
jgi:hypothetical protein